MTLTAVSQLTYAQSAFKSSLPVKPAKGVTVSGTVECDGQPVAGIKVSDGYEVTKTDKNGAYYLKSKKKNPQVFISVPSGYEAWRDDAIPQYWADFTETPATPERLDFRLKKRNDSKHAILVMTDLHLANQRNDVATFSSEYMDRIRKEVKDLEAKGYTVFSFHLGDGSWDEFWYVNDFPVSRLRDTFNRVSYPVPLYNIMGNHDNNGGEVWEADKDMDLEAAKPFMKAFGPRYFSFDAGDVHYIFLDNIIYRNESTEKEKTEGIAGKRNFLERISPEQFDWLRKDLFDISPETPIVIAMHCPLVKYKGVTDEVEYRLEKESAETLLDILAPYKEIHTLTGHSHRQMLTRMPEKNIVDHNITSASGSTWWTSAMGCKSIGTDGIPGGYEVFTIDGNDIRWRYSAWDFEPERQFMAFDLNKVKEYLATDGEYQAYKKLYPQATDYDKEPENTVYVCVWSYDPLGKLTIKENGKELTAEMFMGENPAYTVTAMIQRSTWLNRYNKNTKMQAYRMFKVHTSSPDSPLEISWTDPFGIEFRETYERPHSFSRSEFERFR